MDSAHEHRPSLIAAALAGDRGAEQEIVRIIESFARHLCRGVRSATEPEWEDVAQEACRRVFPAGLQRFRPGGPERSYLYTIVKSTRIQLHRSLSRRIARERAVETKPIVEVEAERRTLLGRILGRLTGTCRALLERSFLDGATHAELASELGLAESSVRSKLTRCLQSARALLAEDRVHG